MDLINTKEPTIGSADHGRKSGQIKAATTSTHQDCIAQEFSLLIMVTSAKSCYQLSKIPFVFSYRRFYL